MGLHRSTHTFGLKRNQNYKGAKKDEEKGPVIPVGFKPFNACKVRFA
jgi:hypothetical protein